MGDKEINESDAIYAHRLETLRSVDDLVHDIHETLDALGQADNTFWVFASDNGFHSGQWCLPDDKRQPYEFDIRVPFILRGPGISANTTSDDPVLMVDVAPTLFDIAGRQ